MGNASPRTLRELVDYLDPYLDIGAFPDASVNGLQVEGSGSVTRIGLAVDACLEAMLMASQRRCDLLIVHHGLFWGTETRLCGHAYRRVRALIRADIALYAAHLPLDAHPEVGNNIQIARRISLPETRPFGLFGGKPVGVQGCLENPVPFEKAVAICTEKVGPARAVLRFGPENIRRLGIVTGSATDPSLFEEASRQEVDLLITGEAKQAAYSLAQEYGLNIFYGGHYQTETYGLKALGDHLSARFELPVEFIETGCAF